MRSFAGLGASSRQGIEGFEDLKGQKPGFLASISNTLTAKKHLTIHNTALFSGTQRDVFPKTVLLFTGTRFICIISTNGEEMGV
jgi:hypothetical protein